MMNMLQFAVILVPILGILVVLIIAMIKFGRNTVTKGDLTIIKDDLTNSIQSLRSEINGRLAEASADREKIREEVSNGFAAASADREKIRDDMISGFAAAAVDREKIRDEMDRRFAEVETNLEQLRDEMSSGFAAAAVDREKIRDEMSRRFAAAAVDRENVRVEARDERKTINTEIIRQNQNYTNSDNKSLINICRVVVGGASLPRLFPLNAQNAQNEIALCVSDRNATFLFRNGITLSIWRIIM